MLKLTIKPGEFIDIGKDIRVVYSGGSNGNIHLLIDATRELNIVRSKRNKFIYGIFNSFLTSIVVSIVTSILTVLILRSLGLK